MNTQKVEELFFSHIRDNHIQSRHQRDISRFLSFIKAFALLNFHKREREGNNIYINERDIDEAYKIWKAIFREQEYGISPYIMNLFQEVYIRAFLDLNSFENIEKGKITGVERKSILSKYFEVYGMTLAESKWRQTIEPTLENA